MISDRSTADARVAMVGPSRTSPGTNSRELRSDARAFAGGLADRQDVVARGIAASRHLYEVLARRSDGLEHLAVADAHGFINLAVRCIVKAKIKILTSRRDRQRNHLSAQCLEAIDVSSIAALEVCPCVRAMACSADVAADRGRARDVLSAGKVVVADARETGVVCVRVYGACGLDADPAADAVSGGACFLNCDGPFGRVVRAVIVFDRQTHRIDPGCVIGMADGGADSPNTIAEVPREMRERAVAVGRGRAVERQVERGFAEGGRDPDRRLGWALHSLVQAEALRLMPPSMVDWPFALGACRCHRRRHRRRR